MENRVFDSSGRPRRVRPHRKQESPERGWFVKMMEEEGLPWRDDLHSVRPPQPEADPRWAGLIITALLLAMFAAVVGTGMLLHSGLF